MSEQATARVARWVPGTAPVAVVMISLNEAHNMDAVLRNLRGWAQEVFLVDSYSSDDTVEIALRHGIRVVQRRFRGFGDQWNFALETLPITAPWTLKLDPDERLTDALKAEIVERTKHDDSVGFVCSIRLFFMDRPLPVRLRFLRLWRTGAARFSNVAANEHASVKGRVSALRSDIEHRDSPDLHHWIDKQNKYTTAEAISAFRGTPLSDKPNLFGTKLQRRMWLKKNYRRFPLRHAAMFLYNYVVLGAWRAGWVGYAWSRLRSDVYRIQDYKLREMRLTGRVPSKVVHGVGVPDQRVRQYD